MLGGFTSILSSPPALPEGWSESLDPSRSRIFYINSVSGHAQWERPNFPASELPSDKPAEEIEPVAREKCANNEPATGTPVVTSEVTASVSQPTAAAESERRSAVATHVRPSFERKAGKLCVAHVVPGAPAPAARARARGERWCIVEDGELFVLPAADSHASQLELKLGLVGVRGVSCPTELQAGAEHAIILELSPEPRSRDGWLGMANCASLVLVAASAEEQLEWQTTLQRVATAYRNWRRLNDAPGAVLGATLGGLKSVGSFAMHAAGGGLGWQVGRDTGAAVSRAVGLR